jgi:hypothetical protein
MSKRAVRRLKRNALFLGALLALLAVILAAVQLAPRNDDTPSLRVPVSADG